MNYPNLETCKAIAGEFSESEFVWVKYFSLDDVESKWSPPLNRINHQSPEYEKIPAPTCEELGEWLKEYYNPYRNARCPKTDMELAEMLFTKNETQARAEAVKLILEGRK